jgi:DNA polymerase III epsilon subunit family exonuclease
VFEEELDLAVSEAIGRKQAGPLQTELSADPLTGSLRDAVVVGAHIEFEGGTRELKDVAFVAFDVETTGFSPERFGDRIVEIAAVRFTLGGIKETWHRLIWPGRPISLNAQRVHGISLETLENEATFDDVWTDLREFIGDAVIVAHNADFDAGFLCAHLADIGAQDAFVFFDTLMLLRAQFSLPSNRLADAIAALGIVGEVTHAALADATATAQLMLRLHEILRERASLNTLSDLATLAGAPPLTPRIVQRTHPHLDLARSKAHVEVRYGSGDTERLIRGQLECTVIGADAGYVTVRVKSGKRLMLRLDKVAEIQSIA